MRANYFIIPYSGNHRAMDKRTGKHAETGPLSQYHYSIRVEFEQPAEGFVAIETIKAIVEQNLDAQPKDELPYSLRTLEGLALHIGGLHASIYKVHVFESDIQFGGIWERKAEAAS